MANRYNVVFQGKTAPGNEIASVQKRLMSMLKMDAGGMKRLFSGKPVVIRKNVDAATAEKFQKALESAGAVCRIQAVEVSGGDVLSQQQGRGQSRAEAAHGQAVSPVKIHYFHTADGGKMIITNIETVPGRRIVEHFGLVSGSTIRAKHVGRDIMASLKNLVGGELKGYTQLLQESRQQAIDRMIEQARHMGANAIVNVRFSTSSVAQGAAELYAYGTAVRIEEGEADHV